jgi:hypothetical protein
MIGPAVTTTVFPPESPAYFVMHDPKTNVCLSTWAVFASLGVDPAGRRPDTPSFYALPGAKPAADWASRNEDGVHVSLHGPKVKKPRWMAHVRGTGNRSMGQSTVSGQLERAQLSFMGAPVAGHATAFAPMVIRTTKRSFDGADLSYPLPNTDGAAGFRLSAPEADDMAHDLVFIISCDEMLPEKPDNAVPAIFELKIPPHVWYLHIECQANKIAEVPSPPFTTDPGLYFARQNGNQRSMLWVHEQAPNSDRSTASE